MKQFKISKGYNTVTKTVRIPEHLHNEICQLSQKNHISFNQLIVQCIEYALENLETDENTDFT